MLLFNIFIVVLLFLFRFLNLADNRLFELCDMTIHLFPRWAIAQLFRQACIGAKAALEAVKVD